MKITYLEVNEAMLYSNFISSVLEDFQYKQAIIKVLQAIPTPHNV
jgi:hypothetical protein